MPETVRLFVENFRGFAPGPLPCDFSALGEYRFRPPDGFPGRWHYRAGISLPAPVTSRFRRRPL